MYVISLHHQSVKYIVDGIMEGIDPKGRKHHQNHLDVGVGRDYVDPSINHAWRIPPSYHHCQGN